jgi:3-deoxy-manno-octulosonate cytidylyltransferase (CMP-KDO synthetase)
MMEIVGVIPARYKSSRFPGKPLADINGKPMIWWVYQQLMKVSDFSGIYIATDDDRIVDACQKVDLNVIKTSKNHQTGTDRVVEVSEKIDADLYVVVMGDEPLIKSENISVLINGMRQQSIDVGMLTTKFKSPVDVVNTTTIKLALNIQNEIIFMSRSPIPFPKSVINYSFYKNIGAYIFRKSALNVYKNTQPGMLEKIEEIELLRLLEQHLFVKAFEIDSDSISVDTPKDLEAVREYIIKNYPPPPLYEVILFIGSSILLAQYKREQVRCK